MQPASVLCLVALVLTANFSAVLASLASTFTVLNHTVTGITKYTNPGGYDSLAIFDWHVFCNNDYWPDFVSTYRTTGGVPTTYFLLIHQNNRAAGTFTPRSLSGGASASPSSARGLVIGDWNNECAWFNPWERFLRSAKPDIAMSLMSGPNSLQVLHNNINTNGNCDSWTLPNQPSNFGNNFRGIASIDLDDDSRSDIVAPGVVPDNSANTMGFGFYRQFTTQAVWTSMTAGANSVQSRIPAFTPESNSLAPAGVGQISLAVDIDNNGRQDVIYSMTLDNSNSSIVKAILRFADRWEWLSSDSPDWQTRFGDFPTTLSDFEAAELAWGDCNNDGAMDVFIRGSPTGTEAGLYVNDGTGRFIKRAAPDMSNDPAGICATQQGGECVEDVRAMNADWGDFDNDGDLDLVFASAGDASTGCLVEFWQNSGDCTLTQVQGRINPSDLSYDDQCPHYAGGFIDYDRDGDLDLLGNGVIWRNEDPPVNGSSLSVKVAGFGSGTSPTGSNRAGIGAKIDLFAAKPTPDFTTANIQGHREIISTYTSFTPYYVQHFGIPNPTGFYHVLVRHAHRSTVKQLYAKCQPSYIATTASGRLDITEGNTFVTLCHQLDLTFTAPTNLTVTDAYFTNYTNQISSRVTLLRYRNTVDAQLSMYVTAIGAELIAENQQAALSVAFKIGTVPQLLSWLETVQVRALSDTANVTLTLKVSDANLGERFSFPAWNVSNYNILQQQSRNITLTYVPPPPGTPPYQPPVAPSSTPTIDIVQAPVGGVDGALIGGVVGGALGLIIIIGLIILLVRRRQNKNRRDNTDDAPLTAGATGGASAAAGLPRKKHSSKGGKKSGPKAGLKLPEYQPLLKFLLANPEFVNKLVTATAATEADDLAKSLVITLDSEDKALPLIKQCISQEVESCAKETTLFRTNSVSTKLVYAYSALKAVDFLKKTLQANIENLITNNIALEVDPRKLDGVPAEENVEKLKVQCQAFLDSVLAGMDTVPQALREVCRHLKDTVSAKFKGSEYKAVGGYMFLRLIGPATVAPEGFQVTRKKVPPRIRRTLILISKVLQTMANELQFTVKEDFMVPLNEFIKTNNTRLQKFFAYLVLTDVEPAPTTLTPGQLEGALELLHFQTMNISAKIKDEAWYPELQAILDKLDKAEAFTPERRDAARRKSKLAFDNPTGKKKK